MLFIEAVFITHIYLDPSSGGSGYKWRAMEGTLEKVGDWAVKALPALLEISKKGGRFDLRDLDSLRPSFRAGELMNASSTFEFDIIPQQGR